MLQGKKNSEVLKSIQTQLSRFLYPQTAREAQQKVNFTKKLLNVYTNSSENGLFLIVFRICLIQQLISVSDIFPGFCFCRCCCFCSTKQNPTFKNYYRESNTLLFLRTKPIRLSQRFPVISLSYVVRAVYRPGSV